MADRVYFATVQDDATPANTSGFNCFPFPFVQSASDAFHPIAISLDECIEYWWRIKSWNLSTDVVVTNGPVHTPMPSGDMTPDPTNASRELDLELASTAHLFSLGGAGEFTVVADINQNSGTLYPWLEFFSTIGLVAIVSFNPASPGLPYVSAGSFTGHVNSHPITVYMFTNSSTGTTIAGSFLDFTPIEWWPYANSDGLPVWNTTTGAQLVNPRS